MRGTDLVLEDHGPTERAEKTSCKIPEMVSQPFQGLMR